MAEDNPDDEKKGDNSKEERKDDDVAMEYELGKILLQVIKILFR